MKLCGENGLLFARLAKEIFVIAEEPHAQLSFKQPCRVYGYDHSYSRFDGPSIRPSIDQAIRLIFSGRRLNEQAGADDGPRILEKLRKRCRQRNARRRLRIRLSHSAWANKRAA